MKDADELRAVIAQLRVALEEATCWNWSTSNTPPTAAVVARCEAALLRACEEIESTGRFMALRTAALRGDAVGDDVEGVLP